jgi:hypothetical protein
MLDPSSSAAGENGPDFRSRTVALEDILRAELGRECRRFHVRLSVVHFGLSTIVVAAVDLFSDDGEVGL